MAGQSTVVADEEQRTELDALAKSRERGEADRARCILLTLSGWSSPAWPRRLAYEKIQCGCGAWSSWPVALKH